jgi:hypothetical protein
MFCRGFRQVTRGPDTGAFCHPLFLKSNPDLCLQMVCQRSRDHRSSNKIILEAAPTLENTVVRKGKKPPKKRIFEHAIMTPSPKLTKESLEAVCHQTPSHVHRDFCVAVSTTSQSDHETLSEISTEASFNVGASPTVFKHRPLENSNDSSSHELTIPDIVVDAKLSASRSSSMCCSLGTSSSPLSVFQDQSFVAQVVRRRDEYERSRVALAMLRHSYLQAMQDKQQGT